MPALGSIKQKQNKKQVVKEISASEGEQEGKGAGEFLVLRAVCV